VQAGEQLVDVDAATVQHGGGAGAVRHDCLGEDSERDALEAVRVSEDRAHEHVRDAALLDEGVGHDRGRLPLSRSSSMQSRGSAAPGRLPAPPRRSEADWSMRSLASATSDDGPSCSSYRTEWAASAPSRTCGDRGHRRR